MNYQDRASKFEAVAALMEIAKDSFDAGVLDVALADLDHALTLLPNSPQVHWNRGQVLMALGRYQEGLREFEWRSHLFGSPLRQVEKPLWNGEALRGKRLLLVHEHGYGDGLMMFRYVPLLQGRGAKVILAVPKPLTRILRRTNAVVVDNWPDDTEFDYYCPIFSVMTVLGHEIKDIPRAEYLKTAFFNKPKGIGIAWSGNPDHDNDKRRSIPIDQMLDGLGRRRLYYSVQKNNDNTQAADFGVVTNDFRDFAEVAAIMARLEHVVTVDTAAAHLAGAIGHPSVHLLLPYVTDWRWYNADKWYPGVHVHRQLSPGDWSKPLAAVRERIQ